MKANEARLLAQQLMIKHGLNLRGWSFEFDSARRRLGVCKHRKKVIGLSRYLLPYTKDDKVRDTILHEIAHALVGAYHGHDRVWRAKAIEIGCDGARCYDPGKAFHDGAVDELAVRSKYSFTCPGCGRVSPVHKRPRVERACGGCCKKHNNGRYDARFKLVLTQNY